MMAQLIFAMMWWVVVVCVISRVAADTVPQWWNNAVYYRMLVDSFKDGDGDGLGDLKGALKQISYVRALGANAIILSPIVARSADCSKPGTVDFSDMDPRYGDLGDLDDLLRKAKKLELKILITLPIQTVSSTSEWFTMSATSVAGFEDRILWQEGQPDDVPFPEIGIEDWKWHSDHRFAYWGSSHDEALLNLCSQSVGIALSAAVCSWLKRGVSGVLVNPDFPRNQNCGEHLLQKLITDARICASTSGLDSPVILVESSLNPEQAAKYYRDGSGASSILSKALTYPQWSTPKTVLGFYASLLTTPEDIMPTWLTTNVNESRTATRYGSNMVDAVNLLALNLPGSAVIQQGDELAAADTVMEWATASTCWPNMPTAWSAPFPWDDSPSAGFTTGTPWLPLAPNYRYANAKTEFASDSSHISVLRVAAALRKSPAFGPYVEIKRLNGAVALLRWGTTGTLLLISNLAKEPTEVQPSKIPGIPGEMTVATCSVVSSFAIASHLVMEKTLKLAPGETVLLAGGPRHCDGPGPVDRIVEKLSVGWQKVNKYFSNA